MTCWKYIVYGLWVWRLDIHQSPFYIYKLLFMNMFGVVWGCILFWLILIAHLMWIFHLWWFGKNLKKWLRIVGAILISIIPIIMFWVTISMIFEKGFDIPEIITVCVMVLFIEYEIMWIIHLCWWGKSWGKVRKIFITIFMSLCVLLLIGMMVKFIMPRV